MQNKTWIILVSISCIIVLVGFVWFGGELGEKRPDLSSGAWGNHLGNIHETGSVCFSNGSFYYTTPEFNCAGLYRLDREGEVTKLSDRDGYCINVVDDRVYFLDGIPGHVCSITTTGEDFKVLVRERVDSLFVSPSAMLYRKGDSVYISNPSGRGVMLVATNVLRFMPHNGKIFFVRYRSAEDGLYSVNPDGSELMRISEEKPIGLCSNGKELYYAVSNDDTSSGEAGGRMYRMDENGETTQLVSQDDCWDINVTDKYIFYRNQTEMGDLYRMDLDGCNAVCLQEGNCVYIQVLEDLVVFRFATGYGDWPSGNYVIDADGGNFCQWKIRDGSSVLTDSKEDDEIPENDEIDE